jgi:peptide/nickel transport system permease protein
VLSFVLRRVLQAVPVAFFSTVLVFLVLHLIPGDPALALVGVDATPQVLEAVRHDMGLDQPLPVQYGIWLEHLAHGDLGNSVRSHQAVALLLAQRIPNSLQLAVAAMLIATALALTTGILAATRQGRPADWLISLANSLGLAVPNFWLGILAIMLFALVLGWLPPGGQGDFGADRAGWLKAIILPACTLAATQSAILSRFVRNSMLEVLHEDHVRTARAKGLGARAVVVGHGLRTALIPIVTVMGLEFGRLLGGIVIVESVFAWPGLGRLILDAIGNRDYPVVQGGLLFLVLVYIAINLITDLAYGFIDPRVRVGARARA